MAGWIFVEALYRVRVSYHWLSLLLEGCRRIVQFCKGRGLRAAGRGYSEWKASEGTCTQFQMKTAIDVKNPFSMCYSRPQKGIETLHFHPIFYLRFAAARLLIKGTGNCVFAFLVCLTETFGTYVLSLKPQCYWYA